MSLCVWRTEATGHWCQRCAWQWSGGAVGPEYRLGLSTSPEVRIPHRQMPSLHNATFLSQCRRPESTPRAKARPCCPTKSMKEGTKKAMMKSAEVIALSPLPHRRWKRWHLHSPVSTVLGHEEEKSRSDGEARMLRPRRKMR